MEGLIEQAKEELEILEYEQPNKFEYLKQDLRDFISELEFQQHPDPTINSIYVDTQESSSTSNMNKRKKVDECVGRSMKKKRSKSKGKSKTEAVLDRAQQCLNKIRLLKTSLSSITSTPNITTT